MIMYFNNLRGCLFIAITVRTFDFFTNDFKGDFMPKQYIFRKTIICCWYTITDTLNVYIKHTFTTFYE